MITVPLTFAEANDIAVQYTENMSVNKSKGEFSYECISMSASHVHLYMYFF